MPADTPANPDSPPPARPALGARFDTRALRPPAAAADEAAVLQRQPACTAALQAWCNGAGPALAVAALQGPPADLAAWADALARRLDGGTRLDALGRATGLAWRLRLKLAEAWPGRTRRPDDPWDAGWALADGPAMAHWHTAWLPRRPTLVLADASQAAVLGPVVGALARRLANGAMPVRWVWVGGDGPAPAGLPICRFKLA